MESRFDKWLRRTFMCSSIAVVLTVGGIVIWRLLDVSTGDCYPNGIPDGRGWMLMNWQERWSIADRIGDGSAQKHVEQGGMICSSFDLGFIKLQQKRDALYWRPVTKNNRITH